MRTRMLYVQEIIPAYERMLDLLDTEVAGKGVMRQSVIDVCNYFNNLVDFIAKENRKYLRNHWRSKNSNEFREALENYNHVIDGFIFPGEFFGYIRDIANTSKHLEIGRSEAKVKNIGCVRECMAKIRHHDEDGYYYDYVNMVVVEDVNKFKIPCEMYLYLTFRTFSEILLHAGLIPSIPELKRNRRSFETTREQVEDKGRQKIKSLQYEEVNFAFQSYIYDPQNPLLLRGVKEKDVFDHKFEFDWSVDRNPYGFSS